MSNKASVGQGGASSLPHPNERQTLLSASSRQSRDEVSVLDGKSSGADSVCRHTGPVTLDDDGRLASDSISGDDSKGFVAVSLGKKGPVPPTKPPVFIRVVAGVSLSMARSSSRGQI